MTLLLIKSLENSYIRRWVHLFGFFLYFSENIILTHGTDLGDSSTKNIKFLSPIVNKDLSTKNTYRNKRDNNHQRGRNGDVQEYSVSCPLQQKIEVRVIP